MKQSGLMSLIESIGNIVVGLIISIAAQAYFLPLFGVAIPWDANFKFAGVMTVLSIVRSFGMRRLFEALHVRRPLSVFMRAVVAERFRQIEVECYDAQHDAEYDGPALAHAAACYALADVISPRELTAYWPWENEFWKPKDYRRNLVRAAALIIAEGDRLERVGRRRTK